LSDVRRPDARSAQIGGPDGISHSFQVSSYSMEPLPPSLARNLFAKDDWRAALGDESGEDGPEVPLVFNAFPFTGDREWLTGTTSSPKRSGCFNPCEIERKRPSRDPGKEVALGVGSQFIRVDFCD
jgi:hypothetical protein